MKGNAVIRMLFDTVDRESPNMSQDTVRSFLSTYSGTTVEPRTFLKMLDKSRGDKSTISSSSLLSRWTSAPGYPLVEIRCHNTDKATATQERFFLSPESKALNKIQMNTHIPGYGIEYAKYWKEGWTVRCVFECVVSLKILSHSNTQRSNTKHRYRFEFSMTK